MTSFQKAIKYAAIAFAILLIAAIVSGICGALGGILHALCRDNRNVSHEILQETETDGEIKNLDIDIHAAELTVKTGDTAKAQTDSEYIDCSLYGNTLFVKEKTHFALGGSSHSGAARVEIDGGAGEINVDFTGDTDSRDDRGTV